MADSEEEGETVAAVADSGEEEEKVAAVAGSEEEGEKVAEVAAVAGSEVEEGEKAEEVAGSEEEADFGKRWVPATAERWTLALRLAPATATWGSPCS